MHVRNLGLSVVSQECSVYSETQSLEKLVPQLCGGWRPGGERVLQVRPLEGTISFASSEGVGRTGGRWRRTSVPVKASR